jgi:hypothetical protein
VRFFMFMHGYAVWLEARLEATLGRLRAAGHREIEQTA